MSLNHRKNMSLRSEYRELGIKRNRSHSSLNRELGDGDPDESSYQEVPEREGRDEKRRYAAYLMTNGEGVVEPLVGRIKTHPTIKKASICRSDKAAERLIEEWQESYEGC